MVQKRHFIMTLMLSLGSIAAMSCSTPGGVYSDPNEVKILGDKWNNTDANKTASHMIGSMLAEPWLDESVKRAKGERPIVIVDDIENRTDEHIDTKALTEAMRTELINSRKVRFVNEAKRQKIMEELKYQNDSGAVKKETAKKKGNQIGADFLLGGAISNTVEVQGDYKTVTYQVNLNLTSLETSEIEWTSNHKIKKSFKR